jgi:two-component system sensor histidine kinase/response regulator
MEKYKILVIEDAKIEQEAYRQILGEDKFEIRITGEARSVAGIAKEFSPDVILMDIVLPDGNGIDVCEKLKSDPHTAEMPVIMVTALNEIASLKNAYRAGAVDYIRKPFNEIELLIRIENVLKLEEHKRELLRLYQDNTVSEMGRAIAHNFNQPLTTIIGSAEMLGLMGKNGDFNSPELRELLDMILDASKKLSKLVTKVEKLTTYKVKDYLKDIKFIDLD